MKQQTTFTSRIFPTDYFNLSECKKILKYKYCINIEGNAHPEKKTQTVSLSQIYKSIRDAIPNNPHLNLTFEEEFVERDLLYLTAKEHLFSHYSSLKISRDKKKGNFVCTKLNRLYEDNFGNSNIEASNARMRNNFRKFKNLPHIEQLTRPDYKVLLKDARPYAIIPYTLIKYANENPILLYLKTHETDLQTNPENKITNGPLINLINSDFCSIGEYGFNKTEINQIFDIVISFITDVRECKHSWKLPNWENYTDIERRIYIKITTYLFSNLYDNTVDLQVVGGDSKHWENLEDREKEPYLVYIRENFKTYYSNAIKKKKGLLGSNFRIDNYTNYLVLISEYFKKEFSEFQIQTTKNRAILAFTYLISEKLLPIYTIAEYLSLESFKEFIDSQNFDLSKDYDFERLNQISCLLEKLSRCPNTYNQLTILNYYANRYLCGDIDYREWYSEFEQCIDYYTLEYYPTLEIAFHLMIDKLVVSNEKQEFLNTSEDFFNNFSERISKLLNTKWYNHSYTDTESIIIELFYKRYLEEYPFHNESYN